ncbi:hypothetical protein A5712_00345 [Mycobacterium sp. E2327]|uniref:hypothetical protein n=1 Tax=Mycobacterium sp. E2327 TaxID=1834132 RepID=UPI0007FD587B|nr:hypothetical protein [Mycobacterium sp. E2327]OBI18302.1 hypothetical protein A5712_00345 [Mycobacterium sp. E2327]
MSSYRTGEFQVGVFPDAFAYTHYFTALVTPHRKRRVTERNWEGFFTAASKLLYHDHRDFNELVELTAWLFEDCGGAFPFLPEDHPDRKVTRVAQIRWFYDTALSYMKGGTTRSYVAKVRYDRPLANAAAEQKIQDLVDAYGRWQNHEPDEFLRNNWAKTLRIMHGHDRHSLADIAEVVTAMPALGEYEDLRRYRHVFALRQEFTWLLELARALEGQYPTTQQILVSDASPMRSAP